MVEREKPTLLAWHADRAGNEVLENALQHLAQEHKVHIRRVLYLIQPKHKQLDKPKIAEGIEFRKLTLPITKPTAHLEIYEAVREKVLPEVVKYQPLHINISPGTPAMHTVWLILHAGGVFPANTVLWSSQYDHETKTTRIDRVDFPINTYLAEIRVQGNKQPELAQYDAEYRSPARQEALLQLSRYARLPGAPLLIIGERGIGKTRLVESHVTRLKQREKLRTVPCGTLDSELADSLLFGHIKGAFSGAIKDRAGLLKEADGGILFLDEIQDLPKPLQRKLVRVFQDRKHRFRSVGSDKEQETDIEIVCASNRHLNELREILDADLFDRFSHLIVEIPPLRDCREDLERDWQRVWDELRTDESLPNQAPYNQALKQVFQSHPLPGNLRDLQRLAYLTMAWWQELKESDKALNAALDEWQKLEIILPSSNEFGQGNYNDRVNWFKKRLAKWAYEQQGSWKKAAEFLECHEKTLRNQ
ncbi:sigma-54 dependent DNA-binding response regulator [Beggiatoa sp. PS]|nr:sigma-54 dependent DNA-binding response regulator [Beggiatoa sp. PS]